MTAREGELQSSWSVHLLSNKKIYFAGVFQVRINGEKGTVYVSKRQTVCGSYDSNVIEFRSPSLRKKENHTKVIDIATYNLQSECEKKN